MAHQPAEGGEEPVGNRHAVYVCRRRFATSQHHLDPLVVQLHGPVRVEYQNTRPQARRGSEAGGCYRKWLLLALGHDQRRIVEIATTSLHRVGASEGERGVFRHVDRHPERGDGAALASASLQHPEPTLLDGELDVDHVAVLRLELLGDPLQFGVDRRPSRAHLVERFREAGAGDHVFPLGLEKEIAHQAALAGRRVPGERYAGSRVAAEIAEDHRLDGGCGSDRFVDLLNGAVPNGARTPPRLEHDLHRLLDLVDRFGRYLETSRPERSGHIGGGRAGARSIEHVLRGSEHDLGVPEQEPSVGVRGEGCVAAQVGQRPLDGRGHPDVEHRVHHPRHRDCRSRPDADEHRRRRRAELFADGPFER